MYVFCRCFCGLSLCWGVCLIVFVLLFCVCCVMCFFVCSCLRVVWFACDLLRMFASVCYDCVSPVVLCVVCVAKCLGDVFGCFCVALLVCCVCSCCVV